MPGNVGKLLVTSNCNTEETSIVPTITTSDDGTSISVDVPEITPDQASSMPFLDSSYYSVLWTVVNDFCNGFPGGEPELITPPTPGGDVPVVSCQFNSMLASTCPNSGEFCKLEMGACDVDADMYYGFCFAAPEACIEQYDPVW